MGIRHVPRIIVEIVEQELYAQLRYPDGTLMDHATAQPLLEKLQRFYDAIPEEDIAEENDSVLSEIARREAAHERDLAARQPKATPKAGVVYLLKCGTYYKIGKSIDFPRRKIQLDTQLPHPADLIHTIASPDPTILEKQLHDRFRNKRLNGEWFDLNTKDVEVLMAL